MLLRLIKKKLNSMEKYSNKKPEKTEQKLLIEKKSFSIKQNDYHKTTIIECKIFYSKS
jgi:hypothetical protein